MSVRVTVSPHCRTRCPSCVVCRPDGRAATLAEVRDAPADPDLVLGGGDATRWRHLATWLADEARQASPRRVWLEAPASALDGATLARLARDGVHGVRVQIEATGDKLTRLLGVGDGEKVIAEAEALGLAAEARVCVRPKTFPIVVPLAHRLAPRPVWLELVRQDWGAEAVTMPLEPIEGTLLASPNLAFMAQRAPGSLYLPPCVLPEAWRTRPEAWCAALQSSDRANDVLPACGSCTLRARCRWDDVEALTPEARASLRPVSGPAQEARPVHDPVPAVVVRRRRAPDVVCVAPWTTMEVVDPVGEVRQCCSTWTVGHRGSALAAPLGELWNGPGYRAARRAMAQSSLDTLCLPVCSRLHDGAFAEERFAIQRGSEAFVRNQLLLAEEIADRREVLEAMPLYLALCPSTYCNYDCIMCDHGRSPRRDLPETIWDELPRFLPTLKSLTLLGGEPLANPHTWKFLRSFDLERYPDARLDLVTNGSLLTEQALRQIQRCALGDVTISFNAGTPEVYAAVQRGVPFSVLLENLDALVRFRAAQPRAFGITLSFVVQPAAAHTLIAFGEIAHARDLRIRLMALNPENHEGLDFYADPDAVARVLEELDRFVAWVERMHPSWLREVRGARQAVAEEAARRRRAEATERERRPADLVPLRRGRDEPPVAAPPRRRKVALLDLLTRPDGFFDEQSLPVLGAAIEAAGHGCVVLRSVLADDAGGDEGAWYARIAEFVRDGAFELVVLGRVWDAALVATLRDALAPGAEIVRLSSGGVVALDGLFDRVLDPAGVVSLLGGGSDVPDVRYAKPTVRELRQRARAGGAAALAPVSLRAVAGSTGAPARPTISGPAGGCPFLVDTRANPHFARLGLDDTKIQTRGCSFCLDNVGAYASPTEAAVLEAWLADLARARAADPAVRELLLTDERPHPFLPAFFRAVRDGGLGPVELLVKSRVDWLLEHEDALAEAATRAAESGSVLHLYLVGFESFEPFHLELFNKGVTVADNVAAIEKLRELAARFPASFVFARHRAHGIVLFTPWTRPEHLLDNARVMREVRFHELRSDAVRTRLRLYPRVPLHALAEADGLLVEAFDEGRGDRAVEQGYDASVPWRFRDRRTEVVYRLATRLSALDRSLTDADVLEAASRFVLRWPGIETAPDDAFLPFEHALKIWWPRGAGAPARTLGFDPESDGIAAGVRRAALKEGVPASRAAAVVRAYESMGLVAAVVERHGLVPATDVHRRGDDYAIVALARDAQALADVAVGQRGIHPGGGDAGALRLVGGRLGYPDCCVEAFAAQRERGDNPDNERLVFRRAPEAVVSPLIARLGEVRLVSHFPCRSDCGPSIAAAEAILARLEAGAADVGHGVRAALATPVLWLDYARRLGLRGSWQGDDFHVSRAVALHGTFAAADGGQLPVSEIASLRLDAYGVHFTLHDGQTWYEAARHPLLVVPGEPLAPPALAAIGGALPPLTDEPLAPLPAFPARIRPGTRVLGYRIVGVEQRGDEHRISLASPAHRFDVRVFPDRAGRSWTLRRGPWAVEVSRPESLPEPARAALGLLVRALPAS